MKTLSARAKIVEWHEVVMECAGRAGAATALSGGRQAFKFFIGFVRAKAVSRCACHRSPRRLQKIALVAGTFGVTVSVAMKTLSAKVKISGLAVCEMIFQTA
jgi:hypothetical protein